MRMGGIPMWIGVEKENMETILFRLLTFVCVLIPIITLISRNSQGSLDVQSLNPLRMIGIARISFDIGV